MGTEQQQPRIVPTGPGKWYAKFDKSDQPEIVNVPSSMQVSFRGWRGVFPVDNPSIFWLAPIPSPAVCAALAEYARVSAVRDAVWPEDGIMTDEAERASKAATIASGRLWAAIRAERDGAA